MIDVEILRELVFYDRETGVFYWKHRAVHHFNNSKYAEYWNGKYAFRECFNTKNVEGYNIGSFKSKNYYAHRVAWAYITGIWPTDQIDHVNGIRNDNRYVNLKHVTHRENGRNQGLKATNRSGHNGVMWEKRSRKWVAQIKINERVIKIGSFSSIEDAIAARQGVDRVMGFSQNHGVRPAFPCRKAKGKKPA